MRANPPDLAVRRSDIDGLRALSVLLVAMYHAQFNDLRGGFIGVDVFFVISGYLIIPMITQALAEGRFSVTGFLLRRLRRLVPAMLPVLLVSAIGAILLLGDDRLSAFLYSLAGAGLFLSNQVFLAEAGYFDSAAQEKLLLHTWSLGVKFQFYLATPLLLWLAGRRRSASTLVLGVLSLGSLWLSWQLTRDRPEAAFFLMPARFWEFAWGGIVALWVRPRIGSLWASLVPRTIGLAMILGAALSYHHATLFPAPGALLPVLGAALVLAAPHARHDPLLWLLSCRPSRWLGLRSYSVYLWHWPLIVIAGLHAERPGEGLFGAMVLLSILLAALTYQKVERPPQLSPGWLAPGRILPVAAAPVLGRVANAVEIPWQRTAGM